MAGESAGGDWSASSQIFPATHPCIIEPTSIKRFAMEYQKFKARRPGPQPSGPPPIGSPPSTEWVYGIFHAVSQGGFSIERAQKIAGPQVEIINLQTHEKISPAVTNSYGPISKQTLHTTGHVTQFIADSSTEQPFQQ